MSKHKSYLTTNTNNPISNTLLRGSICIVFNHVINHVGFVNIIVFCWSVSVTLCRDCMCNNNKYKFVNFLLRRRRPPWCRRPHGWKTGYWWRIMDPGDLMTCWTLDTQHQEDTHLENKLRVKQTTTSYTNPPTPHITHTWWSWPRVWTILGGIGLFPVNVRWQTGTLFLFFGVNDVLFAQLQKMDPL